MKSFIYYCNYCNAKLDVASDLENTDIVCPVCNKTITPGRGIAPDAPAPDAPAPDAPMPDAPVPDAPAPGRPNKSSVNPPVKKDISENINKQYPHQPEEAAGKVLNLESGSAYRSGRVYCLITRIMAAIVLIIGIILSCYRIAACQSAIQNHPLKDNLEKQTEIFKTSEKELIKLFSDAVNLVPEAAGGLDLSASDTAMPEMLYGSLADPVVLQSAYEILSAYAQKIAVLKLQFQKKYSSGGKNNTSGIVTSAKLGVIKVTTGKKQIQFYTNNALKEQEVLIFKNYLLQLKSTIQDKQKLKLIDDLEKLCHTFQYKIIRGGNPVLTTTVTHSAGNTASGRAMAGPIPGNIDFLLEHWQLDVILSKMEQLLDSAKENVRKFGVVRKDLYRDLCSGLVALWAFILLVCFILLLLAEFLRAIFDMADIQRKMLSEKGLK